MEHGMINQPSSQPTPDRHTEQQELGSMYCADPKTASTAIIAPDGRDNQE